MRQLSTAWFGSPGARSGPCWAAFLPSAQVAILVYFSLDLSGEMLSHTNEWVRRERHPANRIPTLAPTDVAWAAVLTSTARCSEFAEHPSFLTH